MEASLTPRTPASWKNLPRESDGGGVTKVLSSESMRRWPSAPTQAKTAFRRRNLFNGTQPHQVCGEYFGHLLCLAS